MKSFTKNYVINASLDSVWDALINPETIKKWSGASATMDGSVGSKFSLWDNSIFGMNTKVVEKSLLEQDWFGGKWEKPSKVVFSLTEKDGKVIVDLSHDNLPDGEADSFNSGWDEFYMGPLKEFCEKSER